MTDSAEGLDVERLDKWLVATRPLLRDAYVAYVLNAGVSTRVDVDRLTDAVAAIGLPHLTASPEDIAEALADQYAALSPEPQPVRHGRHCPCSACAREDWTNPDLAPCDYHGIRCAYSPKPQPETPHEHGPLSWVNDGWRCDVCGAENVKTKP